MVIYVEKAGGKKQAYRREKVLITCLKLGLTKGEAEKVADEIEKRVFDGMRTAEILKMIFKFASRYRPHIKHVHDLRKAISQMQSKPDFEVYVRLILKEEGYEVLPNTILRGKCGEHEVDGLATKNNVVHFVEAKHHLDPHTPTDLDVGRIARAIMEDLDEGFKDGITKTRVDKALIVCNTRLSDHARTYAECRGIQHIGWGYPPERDLQMIVTDRQLYPVTLLKGVKNEMIRKLSSVGVITLKQLASSDAKKLARKAKVGEEQVLKIIDDAKDVLG